MMDKRALLENHQLKKTTARLQVLEEFGRARHALSQPDLEKKVGEQIDRVTLYRILNMFEEKGILHKVIDDQGTGKYALCGKMCTAHHHHDEHLHFNCTVCHHTYCLDNFSLPGLSLPAGFELSEVELSARGICADCRNKHTPLNAITT